MLPGAGTILDESGQITPSWFNAYATTSKTFQLDDFSRTSALRLITVSNRLPSTAFKDEKGEWKLKRSTGGLASALGACESLHMLHIGWPGAEISDDMKEAMTAQLKGHDCVPVYLNQREIDKYYNGFSNGVLWPIFHSITPALRPGSMREEWNEYVHVNRQFADAIIQVLKNSDSQVEESLVWIHDYHLMLVPQFVRASIPSVRIGWFLHTPFPSYDMFRIIPFRMEILRGILSSNYAAFQIPEYASHFTQTCRNMTCLHIKDIGTDATHAIIDASSIGGPDQVHVGSTPIGIDPEPFMEAVTHDKDVTVTVEKFRELTSYRRVILGVDRLDYMKGIEQKFYGYEEFLKANPEWIGNCVLVQLAVPSRGDVKEYQRLKKHVHEIFGEISGKHSDLINGPPVIYLDQSVGFKELVALYRVADVMLITSVRDGMNLVAFEYIASQINRHGTLILSEFAGASRCLLRSGALTINPWDTEDISKAILKALTMTEEEKFLRYKFCLKHVTQNTATNWAKNFIHNSTIASKNSHAMESTDQIIHWFLTASDSVCLLVIDLEAFDEEMEIFLSEINSISNIINVLIVSSLSESELTAMFPNQARIVLGAESGAVIISPSCRRSRVIGSLSSRLSSSYTSLLSVMELYQNLYPLCSRIEESLVKLRWTSSPEHVADIGGPICEILSGHSAVVDILTTPTSIAIRDREYGDIWKNVDAYIRSDIGGFEKILCLTSPSNVPKNSHTELIKYIIVDKAGPQIIKQLSKSISGGPIPSRGG
jgi:trehalose 6-phosphate synthase